MAAKKSNKTEHVLKLITKNDEALRENDYFDIPTGLPQAEPVSAPEQAIRPEETASLVREVQQEESAEPLQAIQAEGPAEPIKEEIAPLMEAVSAPVQQPKEPPTVRAFREQESAGTTAAIVQEQSDDLVNIAEVLAREKLALVMERMKVCTCRTCVNDVLALALNSLPTKYVTTDTGKKFFQLDVYKKQYETDILAALTKACVRVKASPRH